MIFDISNISLLPKHLLPRDYTRSTYLFRKWHYTKYVNLFCKLYDEINIVERWEINIHKSIFSECKFYYDIRIRICLLSICLVDEFIANCLMKFFPFSTQKIYIFVQKWKTKGNNNLVKKPNDVDKCHICMFLSGRSHVRRICA